MKRFIPQLMILVFLICALAVPASAASAYPNQQLSFRTGPNTRYTELFTLPQSTYITPIEYESGNDVTWVLCEFSYKGETYQGYTGLKRMDIYGTLDYASHYFQSGCMKQSATVYAAPTSNGAVRGKVGYNEMVTYLRTEGDYDFIEFYDASGKAPSRGWVYTDYVALSDYSAAYIVEAGSVYNSAGKGRKKIGKVGKNEIVGYVGTESGYDMIVFYDSSAKSANIGYVDTNSVVLSK